MTTAFPAELQYYLHLLKFLMGYDGFVHILHYNPVLFLIRKRFLDIDGSFGTLMPNCCASVFVLMQDAQHRMIIPAVAFFPFLKTVLAWMFQTEVTARCQYAVYVQNLRNLSGLFSCQRQIKNPSHHRSRFRINRQLVADSRVKLIAVRSNAAHILALLHHLQLCRCGLHGQVFAVRRIDNISDYYIHSAGNTFIIVAVITIID